MSEPIDPLAEKLIADIENRDFSLEDTATAVKNLKTYAEAKKLLEPDPIPEPEPSGPKAFFVRHAGDLIKVGGTLSAIALIAAVETKGDVIFRTKASKYI